MSYPQFMKNRSIFASIVFILATFLYVYFMIDCIFMRPNAFEAFILSIVYLDLSLNIYKLYKS